MHNRKFMKALAVAVFVFMAMMPALASADHGRTIDVDIVQNMASFVADEAPLLDNGFPAYGNAFIIQGYLYPAGTTNGANGILPNGDPEFPDELVGEWTCRGWFIGNGMATSTGPWVISSQLYDFGGDVGSETVITEGYEIVDFGVPVTRGVTGGTGRYKRARGEQTQVTIGVNPTGAFNFHSTIRFR